MIELLQLFMEWAGTGLIRQRWSAQSLHDWLPLNKTVNNMANMEQLIPFLLREGRIVQAPPAEGVRVSSRSDLVQYTINLDNPQIQEAMRNSGYPVGDSDVANSDASKEDFDDDDPEAAENKSVEPGEAKDVEEKTEAEDSLVDHTYAPRRKRVCFIDSNKLLD